MKLGIKMNSSLKGLTEHTINELLEGNDFVALGTRPYCTYSDFNARIINRTAEKNDLVLLDIGGADGSRIAKHVKQRSSGSVYVIDPKHHSDSYAENCKAGIIFIEKEFDNKLDLLAEEQKPKAFISLRTDVKIAYQTIEAALEHNAYFIALEPLFFNMKNISFPMSNIVKHYYDFFRNTAEQVINTPIAQCGFLGMPVAPLNKHAKSKFSALKQLIVLDLANTLSERNYDVEIYPIEMSCPRTKPADSEHFLVARKD